MQHENDLALPPPWIASLGSALCVLTRIQNHDNGILMLLLLVVFQPILHPMLQSKRLVEILVTVPRDPAVIGSEMDQEFVRQFLNVGSVKRFKVGLLGIGASRGDAHDIARLGDAVGEVEEHEGLPVLGGGAGCGEGGVVHWKI